MPPPEDKLEVSSLVKTLLEDPTVKQAVREYYSMTLSLRHFFRSHFASLPLGMRDYDLPPEHVLGAIEEDLESALMQDILARESGGRTQSGSKTFSRVKITDEVKGSLKGVIWDEKGKIYRRLLKGETPPAPTWFDPRFPDPFLYFGLKHIFKQWHTTRIWNVFRGTLATAMAGGQGAGYGLGIGAQARRWAAAWKRSTTNDLILYEKVLAQINVSAAALVDFITEARLPSSDLHAIILDLPDNLSDFSLVRNKCRALRNKYDTQSSDGLGAHFNRKKWIGRFLKLKDFLLLPYTARPAGSPPLKGTPPPVGGDLVIKEMAKSPLLIYLAYPEEIKKIGASIPAGLGAGVGKIVNWIKENPSKGGRIRSLARLYPSVPVILDPGQGSAGMKGFVPPLTAQDLLRGVMQALAISTRQEFNAITNDQKLSAKRTRRLENLRSLEARLVNLLYAHQYFGANVADTFGFLVNPPAFFPKSGQANLIAAQVLSIMQRGKVREKAMAGLAPDNKSWFEHEVARFSLVEGDEEDTRKLLLKGGFQGCISHIIQVLVTIRVMDFPVKTLRDFVIAAQEAWDARFGDLGTLDPLGLLRLPEDKQLKLPSLERDSEWTPKFMPLVLSGSFRANGIGDIQDLFSSVTPAMKKGQNIEYRLVGPPITEKSLVDKQAIPYGKNKKYLPVPEEDRMFTIANKITRSIDPIKLNNSYTLANDAQITKFEGEMTEIDKRLTALYPAERDLIALRRKAIIWYFLNSYIGYEVSLDDDPNIVDLLQKRLEDKQSSDLFTDEIASLKEFIQNGDITAESIGVFVRKKIVPYDVECAFLLSAWVGQYGDACKLLGIDTSSNDFLDTDDVFITKFLGVIRKVGKIIDSFVKKDGSQRMSLVNSLRQALLDREILSDEKNRLKSGIDPKLLINSRTRFQRALEYLESEFKTQGTPLYSFVNDEKGLLCEVVVPRPIRKRIEGGAFIDAIQILPPTKGYRVMANISIKGKRETVRIVANFAWVILHSTIKILVTGGCIGLDQNRIYYPRAFAHARVGVEGGDLEPVDIPGIDLALLLDLVKFTGEDVLMEGGKKAGMEKRGEEGKGKVEEEVEEGSVNKIIRCEFNSFMGNAPGSGSFHADAVLHSDRFYPERIIPAQKFLTKVRRGWIAESEGAIDGRLEFPLAAGAGSSKLYRPDAANPFVFPNSMENSYQAGFSDQIGAPQAFWGVKRIHGARKIRHLRQLILSKRYRISENKDKKNPNFKTSRIDPVIIITRLRRQLTDIGYRESRNESLRRSIGEYLSRTLTYLLSIVKNPVAYSAEKLSLAIEGKRGGLAEIIKQMFKNLGLMWRKAARRVVEAGMPAIPPYNEVTAAGTSKYCYACGIAGFTGIIDRRVSKDFGYCKRCGIIVDCHLNAAMNIAALHPQCMKEKGKGGVFKQKDKRGRKKKKKTEKVEEKKGDNAITDNK